MTREHRYETRVTWAGRTSGYRAYSRNHEIAGNGKLAPVPGSADPAFRGDPARYSPEELLLAALSSCHMLWTLHLCAEAGVEVTEYADEARATMRENADGSGEFTEAVLRPRITVAAGPVEALEEIHHRAHELCFIARSVNFEVRVEPAPVMWGG